MFKMRSKLPAASLLMAGLLSVGLWSLRAPAADERAANPEQAAPANQPKGESPVKAEIKNLQGTWGVVTLEAEGAKMAPGVFKGSKIVIKGEAFTTISMGATYKGTFSVDVVATPKTIDLNFTEGPEAGHKSLGIYELDGDTWKLCLTVGAKDRPKTFATKAGSGLALETLKREVGNAPASAPEKAAAAAGEEWTMVSGERDGHPLPEVFVKGGKRVIQGNEVTVTFGGTLFLKATFTLDSTKTPHAIDYTITAGADKGKKQYGIYEADANTFRTCFAAPGKDRPTQFTTKAGDGQTLSLWKRAEH
jgi:uncharacterized protein (TIGR03067 family)